MVSTSIMPFNTFTGTFAGQQNATGTGNTFTGFEAGYNNTTGNNNIYIGNLGPASGAESSTIPYSQKSRA